MSKHGHRRRKVTGAIVPSGLSAMAEKYFEWMRVNNYSEQTVRNCRSNLGYFIAWCGERGLLYPTDITKPIVERYQRHLFYYRKKDGRPLSIRSRQVRITPVRTFFSWLARSNRILYNPASDIDLPRPEERLPQAVLSTAEADRILNQPDVSTPTGIRDRAILETFYSTGMRRLELIHLTIYNVDLERGTVMVRQGKGRKDRMLPIGDHAVKWIEKYLYDVRPELVVPPDEGTLFLNRFGEAFSTAGMTRLVREYIKAAGVKKGGSCHLFRHTMATLMLENGADIRYIQQMLGHRDLECTQMYTRVSIRKLKQVHTLTHPSNREAVRTGKLRRELDRDLDDDGSTASLSELTEEE